MVGQLNSHGFASFAGDEGGDLINVKHLINYFITLIQNATPNESCALAVKVQEYYSHYRCTDYQILATEWMTSIPTSFTK